MRFAARHKADSHDSMNSASRFFKTKSGTNANQSFQVQKSTASDNKSITFSVGYADAKDILAPWPMSSKLVRYRIRDDTFNASSPWSVVGVYYPLPKIYWYVQTSVKQPWSLYAETTYSKRPSNSDDQFGNEVMTLVVPYNIGSQWTSVVASFTKDSPPSFTKNTKDARYTRFTRWDEYTIPWTSG